jgi:hypothetical protein
MSGNSDDDFEEPKKKSGQADKADSKHANMRPEERDAMVEWLGMEREGQKDGQPMQNWRCVYGGAAKGRNMNDDAGEVHAAAGYARLAAFVNSKCKIKTDKRRAWDAEIAEKRWTDLKKKYRLATRMQEPLNTQFETDGAYHQAKQKFEEGREKCCRDYVKIHEMLKDHPGIHPYMPNDSMRMTGEVTEEEEPVMRGKGDSMGLKKRSNTEEGGSAAKKKKKGKKPEFHLRKPEALVSTGKQRMNIHQMFIETQQKQVDLAKQKLLVDAIGKLAAAAIQPESMVPYLQMMGLEFYLAYCNKRNLAGHRCRAAALLWVHGANFVAPRCEFCLVHPNAHYLR